MTEVTPYRVASSGRCSERVMPGTPVLPPTAEFVPDRYCLYFQPMMDLAGGGLHGAEVLVRRRGPDGDLERPASFLPAMQDSGTIAALDSWVLEAACRHLATWRREGQTSARLAVNLSRQALSADLEVRIMSHLARYDLPPRCLEVEFSEAEITMSDVEHLSMLSALRNAGIALTVDNFGAGRLTLGDLSQLPVSRVKIDRATCRRVCADHDARQFVRGVIHAAYDLSIEVAAVGVETLTQADFLCSHGIEVMQGTVFSPPRDAVAMRQMQKCWVGDRIRNSSRDIATIAA